MSGNAFAKKETLYTDHLSGDVSRRSFIFQEHSRRESHPMTGFSLRSLQMMKNRLNDSKPMVYGSFQDEPGKGQMTTA